jgi:hypothetical protein
VKEKKNLSEVLGFSYRDSKGATKFSITTFSIRGLFATLSITAEALLC